MSAIEITNLTKHFGQTKAVDSINFTVEEGETFGFLGPNGAGKTTSIRCMMDLLRPSAGSVSIFGKDAQKNSAELKKDIGFLSADVRLYPNWTSTQHFDFVRSVRKTPTFEKKLIEQLHLDPTKKVKNLSTGNKQKLGLILALMHNPKLLILDEPTTGLDPILQNTIYEILATEIKDGSTVFLSSHNLAEVERICDRVCIIKQGKVVATERIEELKQKKIYTVLVYFSHPINREEIQQPNVEIIRSFTNGFELTVKGEIGAFLHSLHQHQIADVEITHANLEQIFLEYYK